MDGMDMDKLAAGRDLDALIAEHVMGYKWMTVDQDDVRDLAMLMPPNERLHPIWIETQASKVGSDWCDRVPHYSTDMADAWQIVDAQLNRGEALSLTYLKDIGPMYWLAEFRIADVHAAADTPMLAICRAALKVVGKESRT